MLYSSLFKQIFYWAQCVLLYSLGALDQSDYNNKNVAKYSNKLSIAQVTVAKYSLLLSCEENVMFDINILYVIRSSDLGVSDQTYVVVSHLGHLIHPGDIVLGYDLGYSLLFFFIMCCYIYDYFLFIR